MSNQWLRKVQLVVTPNWGEDGRDLSDMHIMFQVNAADSETPNTAYIRVFNLSKLTSQSIMQEYSGVILSAGYQDSDQYGLIFRGVLKQMTRGRENPTDSYLDIYAADADSALNFARINKFMPAPVTPGQQLSEINRAFAEMGVAGSADPMGGAFLPRDKLLYGLARDYATDLAQTQMADWSIQHGQLQFTPKTGYRAGDIVEVNQDTGMIGVPQQTQEGIMVRTLLNPRYRIGNMIRLNAADISQTVIKGFGYPKYASDPVLLPMINDPDLGGDGLYRVFVIEHRGDTRGMPWYTDLICLAAPGGQVSLF